MSRFELKPITPDPPRPKRGRQLMDHKWKTDRHRDVVHFVFWVLLLVACPAAAIVAGLVIGGTYWRRWRLWAGPAVGGGFLLIAWLADSMRGERAWVRWLTSKVGGGHHTLTAGAMAGMCLTGAVVGCLLGGLVASMKWVNRAAHTDRPRPKSLWRKHKEKKLIGDLQVGRGDVDGVVTFGVDPSDGLPVEAPWTDFRAHGLVIGSPGSGKTVTSLRVVRAAIRDGLPSYVIDLKGSPKLHAQLQAWCQRWDRPLYVFGPEGGSFYDPIRGGSPSRKKDLLIVTGSFDEPHYRAKAEDYLLAVFQVLEVVGVPAGKSELKAASELLDPTVLAATVGRMPNGHPAKSELLSRVQLLVDEYEIDKRSLAGIGPRVRRVTESVLGPWLTGTGTPEQTIDLKAAHDEGAVVLFSLPGQDYPQVAATAGQIIVQDLTTFAGALQAGRNTRQGIVFCDEFAVLGSDNVAQALGQSRESGLAWLLSTQSLGDLYAVGGDAFVKRVLTNTSMMLIHSLGDADTAAQLAPLGGDRWAVEETNRVTGPDALLGGGAQGQIIESTQYGAGGATARWVRKLRVEPDQLLNQPTGQFTLLNRLGGQGVVAAKTIPDMTTLDLDGPIQPETRVEVEVPVEAAEADPEPVWAHADPLPQEPAASLTEALARPVPHRVMPPTRAVSRPEAATRDEAVASAGEEDWWA